jgi:hypothetical protein
MPFSGKRCAKTQTAEKQNNPKQIAFIFNRAM